VRAVISGRRAAELALARAGVEREIPHFMS
jgi:hypothetical protein